MEKPDPALKKPNLYLAAKENNTDEVLDLLDELVPPTYIDKTNGWTVRNYVPCGLYKWRLMISLLTITISL